MVRSTAQFKKIIETYYRKHQRAMPWRETHDPYRILVSEIMLQQTQVARVTKFYEKFIKNFPDFGALANAKTADVLRAWQGLGYNRRALALQRLAQEVVEQYNGKLPRDVDQLLALPGIGPYTAGAVRAFAWNQSEIFIETNIRRVFIHFFFINRTRVTDAAIRRYIEETLDRKNPRGWYYALMDYGAMLGDNARGERMKLKQNPNQRSAHYAKQAKFVGSDREIRGKILSIFAAQEKIAGAKAVRTVSDILNQPSERVSKILNVMKGEGFLSADGKYLRLGV